MSFSRSGNLGAQGLQGLQGLQGHQGLQGAQGLQGFQGNQGFQGFQGNQGFQGLTGSVAQGFQGLQGAQGLQGLQGAQGNQGFQGSQGNQGFQGVASVSNAIAAIYIIDGGGSTITTGIKGDLEIPFNATITQVTMLADQTGSIVVDIWKDTYGNYPPLDADSITASAVPTISTNVKSQDSTLTGWTTTVTAGNTLRFNVDSVTSITRVTIILTMTKT